MYETRNIPHNIRAAREAKGLTRTGLADRVRVDRRHVWRMERGDKGPSLDLLVRIADALGVTTDWLLQDHGHAPADAPTVSC